MQHKGAMDPFPRTHVGTPQKGNLKFLGPPLSNGFNKGLGVLFVAHTEYNLIQSMLIAIQNADTIQWIRLRGNFFTIQM